MDIRNVQKTGNMFYVYLPTSWCKKYKITPHSKVALSVESNGKLSITPEIKKERGKHIELALSEHDQSIINKLIVACYINPAVSFKINLNKEIEFSKLLDQKKLISVELVEFDGKNISCESSILVEDPFSLLKTMLLKIKNMLHVMVKSYSAELINRYEEEIDRSKLLITKAVIGGLTFVQPTAKLRSIDLHYIALISQDLERMVDNLLLVSKKDKSFFKSVSEIVDFITAVIESQQKKEELPLIDYAEVIELIKRINRLKRLVSKNHYKINVHRLLLNVSEVMLDWSITMKLD